MNTLYYGGNIDVMRRHLKDKSVDLIYLDPALNSNANNRVSFAGKKERGTTIVASLHVYLVLSFTPLATESVASCLS